MTHSALVYILSLLYLALPMHGYAQSYTASNSQPVSPAARQLIQAGHALVRSALQDPDAMTLSQAKEKGLPLKQCTVEFKTLMGLRMFLRGCRPIRAPFVVVEVTTDASRTATLAAGLYFGMPLDQALELLGTPSSGRTQSASATTPQSTDLYYMSAPDMPDPDFAHLSFEGDRLVRVRWRYSTP